MGKLKGKVALVTGASKGIGAGIARALGAAGAAVVVNYSTDAAGAERVVQEIVKHDGRAIAVQGSVAQPEDVERLFTRVLREFGAPDIVVNNAGVFQFDPLETVTPAEFHRQFDTNVLGALLVTQQAARHFGPAGGSVINVSSVVSANPGPGQSIYASTKAALDAVTRVLARELGPRKIRVNSLSPGFTETEGSRAVGIFGTEFERQMIANTPLGRVGQPDDIAPVAVFLASDEAHWITGESIRVAGGQQY
jgi:3-oxoacyl-[acyl-carrier protein] reductase